MPRGRSRGRGGRTKRTRPRASASSSSSANATSASTAPSASTSSSTSDGSSSSSVSAATTGGSGGYYSPMNLSSIQQSQQQHERSHRVTSRTWLICLITMASLYGGWILVRSFTVTDVTASVSARPTLRAHTTGDAAALHELEVTTTTLEQTKEKLWQMTMQVAAMRAEGGQRTGSGGVHIQGAMAARSHASSGRLFALHDGVSSDAARWAAWSESWAPLMPWSAAATPQILTRLVETQRDAAETNAIDLDDDATVNFDSFFM